MNLYIQFRANKMPAHLIDAEGVIVGSVQQHVAHWLIQRGVAMDITSTDQHPFTAQLAVIDGGKSRVCGIRVNGVLCHKREEDH